ncbi:MAG: hypothetical protein QXJ51_01080 [Sulfolobales archaeon]
MPRIIRGSLLIDFHRIISKSEDSEILLLDLLRDLLELRRNGCSIYVSKEPFTANMEFEDRVYRISLGISTLIISCDNRDLYKNISRSTAQIVYTLREDVWLRVRYFENCIRCENTYVEELIRELGIRKDCEHGGFIGVEKDLSSSIMIPERPAIIFLEGEGLAEKIGLRRNLTALNVLSFMIDDLYSECVYTDPGVRMRGIKADPLILDDKGRIIAYEIDPEVFLFTCVPKKYRDPLNIISIFYALTHEHLQIE